MQPKILIVGFGSIGQRHYRNLLALGYKDVKVYDPLKHFFSDNKKISTIKSFSIKSVKEFQVVLVCSPNNYHLKQALVCAKAGCHIFIEKPLSHNLAGIGELIRICEKSRIITMVGCNMRFHPAMKFIKKYLEENLLGKIYSIQNEFGYYLPYWRPGQDYTSNYAANKRAGGGIILDDIHEFDLLFWLNDFEKIRQSKLISGKVSNLKIQTEDLCLATFRFNNKVLGLVKSDYLQQRYSRGCKIIGEKGNLEWDYLENIVWLKNQKGNQNIYGLKKFDSNQMYLDEIKYFFGCIRKNEETFNNVSVAAATLNNVLKI